MNTLSYKPKNEMYNFYPKKNETKINNLKNIYI